MSWPWSVCFSIAVDTYVLFFPLGITAPFCSTPAKRVRKECLNDRIDQSLEVSFDKTVCMKICFECKNTRLQLNVSFTDSQVLPHWQKKLSIAYAFQSSSLIQVFWVRGAGGSSVYVHLYVTPGEVS